MTDDVAGKAYVEQFALETFERADNAVKANKATKVTADTYSAAAVFLDLLAVWGPIDPEIAAKAKYAKFHALRILKAIKAGEDPNLSNPKTEPDPEEVLPQLDPDDAEVRALEGNSLSNRRASVVEVPDEMDRIQAQLAKTSSIDESLHPSREQSTARPPRPSVTEIPDEAHRLQSNLARLSSKDESLHPSRVPSPPQAPQDGVSPLAPQDAASFYTSTQPDVSPIEPPAERRPSVGGNYFPLTPPTSLPSVPQSQSQPQDFSSSLPAAPTGPSLPSAPSTFASKAPAPDHNPLSPPEHQHIPPSVPTQSLPPQPYVQSPAVPPPSQPPTYTQTRPPVVYAPPANQPHPPPPVIAQPLPPQQIQTSAPIQTNVVLDEEAIMKAQKHARWAISALNFEDVPTAIKELQGALAVLGAR